jgi:hypothetical protein
MLQKINGFVASPTHGAITAAKFDASLLRADEASVPFIF